MVLSGHEVCAPERYAAVYRGIPCKALPWTDDPHSIHGWLSMPSDVKVEMWIAKAPQIIDAVRQAKPDVCILWTDTTPMMRIVALACRNLGVPVYELTHGAMNTYRQGHFEVESYVDGILAPGQEEADFRAFYGVETPVTSTGKPSYDWIMRADLNALRSSIRAELNLPDKRPVIVYGMTWRHPFSTWERDEDLGEGTVAAAHMNLQRVCAPFLVFKPHYCGGQNVVANLQEACKTHNIAEYGIFNGSASSILPAADLVVSHKSSLLVEAILMGKPCVGFDFRARNDFAFYQHKGIEWVNTPDELLPAMTRCLLDRETKDRLAQERESAVHYFNGPNDGNATGRVIDELERASHARQVA